MSRALTPREREVLKLIADGYETRDVCERLNMPYNTVRTHRQNILRKTRSHTITQAAVKYALEQQAKDEARETLRAFVERSA